MHASSIENMQLCYSRFIEGSLLESMSEVIVLDIGGDDVNGNYREVFQKSQFTYLVADLATSEGVSIKLEDPYRLPLDDASIDVVVSGQMLEHCEFFWLSFAEMARVVKPNGFIFLITPSEGPIHRYPVDCYRFYPDAYSALAKYANCQLVDVWRDERGPWKDLVGVFRRHAVPSRVIMKETPKRVLVAPLPGTLEEEMRRGDVPYLEILSEIHQSLKPSLYLEIGVRHGNSLRLAQCRAVGIDPAPEVVDSLPGTTTVVTMTSDDFFRDNAHHVLQGTPDLVFIDGMHLFENSLRDFMHSERLASPGTLVVFDDVFPNHPAQATRNRRTQVWTGDVWKIAACLRTYRPDLFVLPINVSPTGLLLVAGLDCNNRVLWDHYNPIVRANKDDVELPSSVLQREGSLAGNSSVLSQICALLASKRLSADPPQQIVAELLALLPNGYFATATQ